MSDYSVHSTKVPFPPLALHAEGFTLVITPLAPYRDSVCHLLFFNGVVSVQTESPLERHSVETFMECYLSDLEGLREDLEAHLHTLVQKRLFDRQREGHRKYVADYIDSILTGDSVESPTWVPLELEMQITCLDGEVSYEEDTLVGEFNIRVMVETPMKPGTERQIRVYTGYEGRVNVQEVITFCAALRACVAYYDQL
jgi:hypothetical protein